MSDEITYYDKDGKTYWSCGCQTWKEMMPNGKKAFVNRACDNEHCPVVKATHDASNERDIPIVHYKAEDVRWVDDEDESEGCPQSVFRGKE
jgi:hypothetical protein